MTAPGIWRKSTLLWTSTLLVAACVPVAVPVQLSHTPGPPVIIYDLLYHSTAFTLRYPAGWRAITSAASDIPTVIFVAPDEDALIYVSANSNNPDLPVLPGHPRGDSQVITLENGQVVTVAISAQAATWEAALPLYEQVAASLQIPLS